MKTELCACCGAECPDRGRVKKFFWIKRHLKDGSTVPSVVTAYFCSLRCVSFYDGVPDEIREIKEFK